jgi:predicted nucleotidyltransferase
MISENAANSLRAWAEDKLLVGKLWVFGSRSRGDFGPDSDIDIAIELDLRYGGFDETGGMVTWSFETDGWEEELKALLGMEVDLQQYRGEDTPTIYNAIRESSCLVYSKSS